MSAGEAPAQIGKYPVVRKLGAGATSEVYLCRDPFYGRDVAVKLAMAEVLRDPAHGRVYKKLFITEASLAGKLQHPHICRIFDAVAEENQHYIVMEYIDGGTLDQFCHGGNLLPIDKIIQIVFKCTRALDYAHKLGITHRDIKPANILYTGDTDIKVTDFGAALVASGETTQVSGIGSPAYMSPQQVKEHPLDHRTDIYSVGVVLYHLLAGRLPYDASNNFALIYQITSVVPPPPSTYRPEIPPQLDRIVQRALAKELEERYPAWEDFSFDLAEAFRGATAHAATPQFADSDRFETLKKLPFFEHFTDAEIWEVARISTWRAAAPGEVLMKEGESGSFFCILAEGQVKVSRKGKLLNILRAGEPFGEMAYLSRSAPVRGADVSVASPAKIISIPTAQLARASNACRARFDRAFIEILVARLAMANIRLSGV